MRISDWSSDVCSSDLVERHAFLRHDLIQQAGVAQRLYDRTAALSEIDIVVQRMAGCVPCNRAPGQFMMFRFQKRPVPERPARCRRSEEHTSELQSLMRTSYAVFCLKKKKQHTN